MLDRLPTKFNLSRRSVDVGSPMCPLCLDGEETVKHLFITCKVAHKECGMHVIGGLEQKQLGMNNLICIC